MTRPLENGLRDRGHAARRCELAARGRRRCSATGDLLLTGGSHLAVGRRPRRHQRHQQRLRDRRSRADPRPLRQGPSRPLWRISADAAGPLRARPVAARARRRRLRSGPRGADARSARRRQGRLPDLLRDHLLGRGGRPPQPAGLPLQSVQRRLVRRLGPAPASRPGAAPSDRGGAAGAPRHPDRNFRRDRFRRPAPREPALAHGRSDRQPPSGGRRRRRPSPGSATCFPCFSRCFSSPSRSARSGLQAGAKAARERTYKDIFISDSPPNEGRPVYPDAQQSISSRPNRSPKAIPTRSPTRFPTPSSTCSSARTRRRGSPARRW